MQYWLLKTEPSSYSIADLKRDTKTSWEGVRNYQARNHLRTMKVGDKVIIYHSSTEVPAAVGAGTIVEAATPDPTALNPKDGHFDPKSTNANNRWSTVMVGYGETFAWPVPLSTMRADAHLRGLELLRVGSRLSVMPVSPEHFAHIRSLGKQ